ncbi:hypothetical protein Nepgr_008139 [Nepenthes gracilis]|uniref:Uncharacterized protein n=1 Tax=Nepenthes gracilis TaxID=150966 RepID=A0AAD3XIZ9_NEPGR|nr:hypothetical protein Nepgr_008139 [Nepenthes gracilis]
MFPTSHAEFLRVPGFLETDSPLFSLKGGHEIADNPQNVENEGKSDLSQTHALALNRYTGLASPHIVRVPK